MERIKCITFDKEAQDNLPQHIKDKMKADRDEARMKMHGKIEYKGYEIQKNSMNIYNHKPSNYIYFLAGNEDEYTQSAENIQQCRNEIDEILED